MARRSRKPDARERGASGPWRGSRWAFLGVAYLFGLLCMVGGVLVMAFGGSHGEQSAEVTRGDLVLWGVMMIVLGLAALGLTLLIQRSKHP